MEWYSVFGQWTVVIGLFTWNIIRTDGMRKELSEKIDKLHAELTHHRITGNGGGE